MTTPAPAITVTVPHIPLTKRNYATLLAAMRVFAEECGLSTDIDDALRWLHYRWLLEQSESPIAKRDDLL
jgi:hypothetical protein